VGIRKVRSTEELWSTIEALGDSHADYLLEQFVPGDVFHVDSIFFGRWPRFAAVSRYATPPMAVAHEGGIFVTRTLPETDPAVPALRELNGRLLDVFGLRQGVSHTEFIRAADGDWHFLETSARVGGAFIVDVIEAATGVNLWREWAKVEIAGEDGEYDPPPVNDLSAGIVLSLARQEHPDTSRYTAPEIVQRIRKRHHAGLIVASRDTNRVTELLDEHVSRFYTDFHASAPAPDRPVE
jgi:hypothetical protein